MNYLTKIFRISQSSNSSFLTLLIQTIYFKMHGKNFIAGKNVVIKGMKNIVCNGVLRLGVNYRGYEHEKDIILLNVQGKLIFRGNYSIGKGCRYDIGRNAVVSIGSGGYINSNSLIIIHEGLEIGDNCSISWNCQFLDTDFHSLNINGKIKASAGSITIGNNVWIGCNVKIYKNVIVPDGCVIASDSVLKTQFFEKNVLIGGNPARILKTNINWE